MTNNHRAHSTRSHTTRTHSPCSASSAHRWLNCPGSVGLCASLPKEPQSPHAAEGTKAHELAEIQLQNWIDTGDVKKAFERVDGSEREDGDWDEEMREHVEFYVVTVQEQIAAFDKEPSAPSMRLETKLTLDNDLAMHGTADFVATGWRRGKATGMVIDLKYGKSRVVAHDNPQLAYYAVALWKTSKKPLQEVEVLIVQPRSGDRVTSVIYSLDELGLWSDILTRAADAAYRQILMPSTRELNVGEHCKWCNARYVCPSKNPPPDPEGWKDFVEES